MSSHVFPAQSDDATPDWRHIEDLLDEIAQFARSDVAEAEFYRALLQRFVRAIGAAGGAVWTARTPGDLRLESQVELATAHAADEPDLPAWHRTLVEAVLRAGQPRVAPPRCEPLADEASGNASDCTLIFCPFPSGLRTAGAIELIGRGPMSAASVRDSMRLLAALVEVGSSRVDLQACKLEYSIVSPK